MKKGTFYTISTKDGDLTLVKRKGYILEKHYNSKSYYFGIDQRYKACWCITETTSGMIVGYAKRLKHCENEVDKVLLSIDDYFNNLKMVSRSLQIMSNALNNFLGIAGCEQYDNQ